MSGIFDQIINYSPPLIVSGTVNYDGTWDASTNTPTLNNPPAGSTKGDYYVVSVAGTQFSLSFAVGDWIISNGTAWEKVDLTDAVSSVFGRTGAVVGVSTDYSSVGLTNTAIGASSPSTGAFTTVSATTPIAVASGGTGVSTSTGTTNVVLSNSPTLVTPDLGTPSAVVLTNASGTASININGTVGGTTPAAGSFTTLSATGNITRSGSNPFLILDRATTGDYSGIQLLTAGASTGGWEIYGSNAASQNLNIYSYAAASSIATFTSTGLNSTAIGASTASTGAFTTLSATDDATITTSSASIKGFYTNNATHSAVLGVNNAGLIRVGSTTNTNVSLVHNGNVIGLVSSTGLAVTGALSATGKVTSTNGGVGFEVNYGGTGAGFSIVRTGASASTFTMLNSGGEIINEYNAVGYGFNISTARVASISSTGLAVTGALSATGTLSGGTSGTGYSFSGSAPATSLTLDASGNLLVGSTTTLGTSQPTAISVVGRLRSFQGSASVADTAYVDVPLNMPRGLIAYFVMGSGNSGHQSAGFFRANDNGASSAYTLFGQSENLVAVTAPSAGNIRITNNSGSTVTMTYTFTMIVGQ